MKKKNIYLYGAVCLTLLLGGCSKEQTAVENAGDTPVELSGMMTRNDGVNGANLYLKALYTQGNNPYFGEILFSVPGGLDQTEKDLVFSGTKPYYPLGGATISLFAFSGKLKDAQNMVLKAGHGAAFDAVLSNFGETNGSLSGEGQGTTGSANLPAEVLHFRHVMTKVTVTVVVDTEEVPPVDPDPTSIQFRMEDVVAQGLYNIRSAAPADENDTFNKVAIVDGDKFYTLQLDDNYLVPTGASLLGKKFSYLKIDDYTATQADRDGFEIEAVGTVNDFILLPGYAYQMEIKVQKLRVTGVTVKLVDWNREEIKNGNVETIDYPLDLMLAPYVNSGADAITKVILHTSQNRIFTGQTLADGSGIGFVRLPNGTDEIVTEVELYTAKGLLLTTDNLDTDAYEFNNNTGGNADSSCVGRGYGYGKRRGL